MLFNSIVFFVFLATFFLFYWFTYRNLKIQNILILLGSYIFYGWWDKKFLILILLSTLVDYFIGWYLASAKPKKAKVYLFISIFFNIGLLGFFKYYNFFVDSLVISLAHLGYQVDNLTTLNIILPVGISFYTFQTMSYTIDVYRGKLKPTKDFIAFAAFVAFFPQLVAGPIERATNLLPQILKKRRFQYEQTVQGLRLMLWGLYKKTCIADILAPKVNVIFDHYQEAGLFYLVLGAIFFSFQIYCDFSGYSDIAIGVSKLLGFELMSNFKFPFFSRNIGEFWRRWHISLSTWFRDYVYIPLGGSRFGRWKSLRNITVVFLVSGLWHGANWTFILWGVIHALAFMPSFLRNTNRKFVNTKIAENRKVASFREIYQMILTFSIVSLAFVIFRSETISHAYGYLQSAFFKSINLDLFLNKEQLGIANFILLCVILCIFISIEWFLRKDERLSVFQLKYKLHYLIYGLILLQVVAHFSEVSDEFIYFQF